MKENEIVYEPSWCFRCDTVMGEGECDECVDLATEPEPQADNAMAKPSKMSLVLSLFPGVGLLDRAFELEGFCIVRGPDVLWGGDIRRFHPPAGRFDGVIAGPPCQAFSSLRHIVKANGHKPRFGNLIPEFERCVAEAEPIWFLMEEAPGAPIPSVAGYATWSTLLNNRQCMDDDGKPAVQNRVRRWTFGDRRTGKRTVLMIDTAALEAIEFQYAATGGHAGTLARCDKRRVGKPGSVREFRHACACLGKNFKTAWAFELLKKAQGLPADFDLPPFLVEAKCTAVGNGVPLPMGRAMARAVKESLMSEG